MLQNRAFNRGLTSPEKLLLLRVMSDQDWMKLALKEAQIAETRGEVPVGAVLVGPEGLVARAGNRRESWQTPLGHAEIIAVQTAAKKLGRWRLSDLTLYVTLEPCPMCAGALVQARLGRLVYGAADPKAGASGSLYQICADPRLNHRIPITSGVLEAECSQILKDFFRRKRAEKKNESERL